jgi:hypothetical protein
MCVTNTTHRRSQGVSLAPMGVCASVLSQRLYGSLMATVQPKPVQPEVLPTIQPPVEKPRPKRRRKPQKPGKTAKMNDRHFVVHNYHDHAYDPVDFDEGEEDHSSSQDEGQRRRGGVAVAFPLKLHAVLDQVEADGLAHVVSWQAHGRCFVVHKPKEFVDHIMPK